LLYFQYKATVIHIQVHGADTRVAYLVGSTMLPTCECARKGVQIRECIGHEITVNPEDVAACYPLNEITTRSHILTGLYLFVTLSLATLIGLLTLRRMKPAKALAKPRR
jgi:hypothetical protein